MTPQRLLATCGLLIGTAALLLELGLQISARAGNHGLLAIAAHYVSFYTVVSNAAVGLVYAAALSTDSRLRRFGSPLARGTVAAMITLTMLVYGLILARSENPHGWAKLSDVLAHYVTPPLYLLWWGLCAGSGTLRWRDIPLMIAPSLVYMAYVLVRGHIMGDYPYAMLNAKRFGTTAVTLNGVYMLIAMLVLCAAAVAADRLRARAKHPTMSASAASRMKA